jgi:hypothetical protein
MDKASLLNIQLNIKRIVVPSAKLNEVTQPEWRELGFFYDRDDSAKPRFFAAKLPEIMDSGEIE